MSPTQWSKVQGLDQIILFGEKGVDNKLKFSLEPKGENAHKKKRPRNKDRNRRSCWGRRRLTRFYLQYQNI